MTSLQQEIALQEKKITTTIVQLRARNFAKNLPFLMLSDKLPEGQGYYEYADGHIEIQEVYAVEASLEKRFIRRLSVKEAAEIRAQFKQQHGL